MLEKVSLNLTQPQARKLMSGKPVQLSASGIKGNKHSLYVNPLLAKKIRKAQRLNKGVRVSLTEEERSQSASGLKEIFEGIKKGAEFLKKNVIDSEFYQKNIRPLAKELVQSGINLLPVGKDLARKGADWASQKTGAFGLRSAPFPTMSQQNTYDPIILPAPGLGEYRIVYMPPDNTAKPKKGGSFRPA
jgi:hypothetical protein